MVLTHFYVGRYLGDSLGDILEVAHHIGLPLTQEMFNGLQACIYIYIYIYIYAAIYDIHVDDTFYRFIQHEILFFFNPFL
jgi:hypothetical protein